MMFRLYYHIGPKHYTITFKALNRDAAHTQAKTILSVEKRAYFDHLEFVGWVMTTGGQA